MALLFTGNLLASCCSWREFRLISRSRFISRRSSVLSFLFRDAVLSLERSPLHCCSFSFLVVAVIIPPFLSPFNCFLILVFFNSRSVSRSSSVLLVLSSRSLCSSVPRYFSDLLLLSSRSLCSSVPRYSSDLLLLNFRSLCSSVPRSSSALLLLNSRFL